MTALETVTRYNRAWQTEAELNAWVRQGVEFAPGLPAKR